MSGSLRIRYVTAGNLVQIHARLPMVMRQTANGLLIITMGFYPAKSKLGYGRNLPNYPKNPQILGLHYN